MSHIPMDGSLGLPRGARQEKGGEEGRKKSRADSPAAGIPQGRGQARVAGGEGGRFCLLWHSTGDNKQLALQPSFLKSAHWSLWGPASSGQPWQMPGSTAYPEDPSPSLGRAAAQQQQAWILHAAKSGPSQPQLAGLGQAFSRNPLTLCPGQYCFV